MRADQIGAVESVKAASDIVSKYASLFCFVYLIFALKYAPISGVVEEVNQALNDQPSLLNKSPEGDGMYPSVIQGFKRSSVNIEQVGCVKSRPPTLPRQVHQLLTILFNPKHP